MARRQVDILEDAVGVVEIQYQGRSLPYSVYDQHPTIPQGEIVENKRLGAVLGMIQAIQDERDSSRLASKKVSLRQKDGIRAARVAAGRPGAPTAPGLLPGVPVSPPVTDCLTRFIEEQRLKRKRANDLINERKRQRQIDAALAATDGAVHGSGDRPR